MGRGSGLLALALSACGFSLNPGSSLDAGDGPLPIDAPAPDGGTCTSVSQTCVDGGTLRTCPGSGMASFDTPCVWSCVTGAPDHCGALSPTGGGLVASDVGLAGLPDVVLGSATINSDTGNITGTVAGTFAWKMVNGISVFRASSIRFDGTIKLEGSRPMAFAANGDIIVAGLIDARGGCLLSDAGPGGFPGGAYHTNGGGMGGGGLGAQDEGPGGGGGGYGAVGGIGGLGDGAAAGTAGGTYGNPALTMLVGGSGGGGGGGGGGNAGKGVGGGGGGAVQLASNKRIRIDGGGGINAGGCGGKGSNNDQNDGAGGGGSGGALLLEAPIVDIVGALAVNGGGGGAAKDIAGASGALTRTASVGGNDLVDGGLGGFALTLTGGPGASSSLTGGGGGGGVGRIRVNTRAGAVNVTGTLSPSFMDDPTTATRGTASVE